MIQEIIVYGIGIAVAGILVYKFIKTIFGKRTNQTFGCSNCSFKSSTTHYKRVVEK